MSSAPDTIAGYQVIDTLSEGRRTTVYRGREPDTGKMVVLKCLTTAHPTSRDLLHFRTEYEIGLSLEGGEFVQVLELKRRDGQVVVVMEDFGAESIADTLQYRRFDLDEFLTLAIDISQIIGQLHNQSVVHRDINPSNLVWNADIGQVKLIDLGLATRFDRLQVGRPSSATMGTLPYISPEQTGRTGRPVDYRTDYYSLGVTLYEMLTGSRPFDSDTPGELIHAHLARRPQPAHHRRRDVPRMVSKVLEKLMAKSAERRYQSAHGLVADLQRCLDEYRATGTVAEFEPGTSDRRTTLELSRRMVGRDRQLKRLEQMVRAAETYQTGLALIRGPAGVGKTTLVERLESIPAAAKGWFGSGKFERPRADRPFGAIAEAFGMLIDRLVTTTGEQLSEWKNRVQEALGDDASLVAGVVPELAQLFDQQIRSVSPSPEEARHRFVKAFRRLAALFGRPGSALVLLLDDMQWADDASLELLESLLTDDSQNHLLVVGTVRDDEEGLPGSLKTLVRRLEDSDRQVVDLPLKSLDERNVRRLVADSLDSDDDEIMELAALIYAKTSGNPLFASQLLEKLHRQGLLWFDLDANHWSWDDQKIAALPVTENVVEMLEGRIDDLPGKTRQVVVDAAFLGNRFRLEHLAAITGCSVHETFQRLQPALQAGVVVGWSDFELLDAGDLESPEVIRQLFFAHDQIREAATQLVELTRERPAIRLRVGRRLQTLVEEHPEDDRLLFSAVRNLNAAIERIDDPGARQGLLELNDRAARRALKVQAVADAAEFLDRAAVLLDDELWSRCPELARRVLLLKTRVDLMEGRFQAVDDCVKQARRRIDDPVQMTDFCSLEIRRWTLQSRLERALQLGKQTLNSIGYNLELSQPDKALEEAFDRVQQRFDGRPVEVITDQPAREDRRASAALEVLAVLQPAAGLSDLRLLLLVGLKSVDVTFDVGVRPDSVVGLVMYGNALCLRNQPRRGYEAGELALELARQFDHQSIVSHVAFVFAAMIRPWSCPLEESLPLLEEGAQAGRRSGNHLFAGFNQVLNVMYQFYLGRDLSEVMRQATTAGEESRRLNNTACVDLARSVQLGVANLLGQTESARDFRSRDGTDVAEYQQQWREHNTHSALLVFGIIRAHIEMIHGDCDRAYRRLRDLESDLGPLVGTFDTGRHQYLMAVALADVVQRSESPDRQQRQRLDELRDRVARMADHAPENFEARLALVDAEIARADGDITTAFQCYDDAIEGARNRDILHLEALASQRAGLFWIHQGKEDFAGLYLHDAYDSFRFWGARRRADELEAQFGHLFLQAEPPERPGETTTSSGDIVDVDSVLRASEVIASHLDLEALLPVLMEVTLENAGAEHGTFVVADDDQLCAAAYGHADGEPVRYDPPVPLNRWDRGPASVVRYVARTHEPLVISRAHRDPRFRDDPYLQQRRPRSICCIPAQEHGRLRGILYLENDLVDDAFSPDRIRVLRVLAGHVAIAVNKARLYAELHDKKERFRQLAENIHEVFWMMEWPGLDVIYLSPAYETVWGQPIPSLPLSFEELMATVVEEDRDRLYEAMQTEMETGNFDEAYRIQRPSGTVRWVHSQAFPITDADGNVHRIAGVARDITREHELAQMKDEFISVVSHELRTPLTPITGIFSMLTREYEQELPDEVNKMTELGLRNSRRLLKLIDDLLDIQRLSMEKIDFEFEIFDVRELVEEALELNEPLGQSRNVDFQMDAISEPLMIRGDQSRLVQVVTNLLSNAVKFSNSGDTVEVEVDRVDDAARVSITDHGPGIPADVRHRIFDKFTQADTTLTRQHGGIGLGLAIARSLVDRFGGRIYFDTEIDEGTTFHVELPLAQQVRSGDRCPPS